MGESGAGVGAAHSTDAMSEMARTTEPHQREGAVLDRCARRR
jgi:hypothetical protein